MAKNLPQALKKERNIKADEAWIDEDWKKIHSDVCEFKKVEGIVDSKK